MHTATRPLVALSFATLLASPAFALTAELTRSGGVIGNSVTYDLQGDPLELFGLAFSFNTGPTPLSLFDASDPRLLSVGLDLVSLWQAGLLDGGGQASLTLPIPPQPSLHGLSFYAQMVTLPGAGTLIDEISALNAFVLGLAQDSTNTVSNHPTTLDGHSATGLDDGRVLLAGGVLATGFATNQYRTFDNQTGAFSVLGATMQTRRTQHTATKLADGRVLTLGGVDQNSVASNGGEIFDPASGTSSPIANMSSPRVGHTATLLADGRVFVAGGTTSFDFSDPLGALAAVLDSTEVYNPTTNTWSGAASLPKPRALHTASLLGNGQVLITGGIDITTLLFIDIPDFTNGAVRFNPTSGAMLGTPSFSTARALHGQVTLSNGNALIVGGANGNLITQTFVPLASARRYNTATNTWTNVASLGGARVLPNLIAAGGTIVAIGGVKTFDLASLSGLPADKIETTDSSALVWTTTGTTILPRALAVSALFDGGQRILTTGSGDNGSGGAIPDLTAEIYVP